MECRKNYHLSSGSSLFCWETIWNVLSQVMSVTIVKFFYILFTTVKAFYQRQIPSVTTANAVFAVDVMSRDLLAFKSKRTTNGNIHKTFQSAYIQYLYF